MNRLRRWWRDTSTELKVACAALLLAAVALLVAALLAVWLEHRGDEIRDDLRDRSPTGQVL